MTALLLNLPKNQKYLLALALSAGLFIWLCSTKNFLTYNTINTIIFIYSFTIPFLFLGFSTIMDLNDKNVFLIWLIVAIFLLIISLATNNMDKYLIQRSSQFDNSTGINSFLADHSTSALKSLFLFLIIYWPLNQLSKKFTGNFIVNTLRQTTWTNVDAKRKMTSMDVICNIVLYITIIVSVLF